MLNYIDHPNWKRNFSQHRKHYLHIHKFPIAQFSYFQATVLEDITATMLLNLTDVAVFLVSIICSLSCLDCNTVAEALHRGRYHRAQVYGQSVINFDGTVGKSLAAVIRVPREQPRTEADWASLPSSARSNEMPKDEPDTTPSSGKHSPILLLHAYYWYS